MVYTAAVVIVSKMHNKGITGKHGNAPIKRVGNIITSSYSVDQAQPGFITLSLGAPILP